MLLTFSRMHQAVIGTAWGDSVLGILSFECIKRTTTHLNRVSSELHEAEVPIRGYRFNLIAHTSAISSALIVHAVCFILVVTFVITIELIINAKH